MEEQTPVLQTYLKIVMDYHDRITDANKTFEKEMEALELEIISEMYIEDPLEAM